MAPGPVSRPRRTVPPPSAVWKNSQNEPSATRQRMPSAKAGPATRPSSSSVAISSPPLSSTKRQVAPAKSPEAAGTAACGGAEKTGGAARAGAGAGCDCICGCGGANAVSRRGAGAAGTGEGGGGAKAAGGSGARCGKAAGAGGAEGAAANPPVGAGGAGARLGAGAGAGAKTGGGGAASRVGAGIGGGGAKTVSPSGRVVTVGAGAANEVAPTNSTALLGNFKVTPTGEAGVVVAATVVGYVPPSGLMVQVQLESTKSEADVALEERAERVAQGLSPEAEEGVATAVRDGDKLSDAEKAEVDRMQARDASVRREEQAHAAAAGDMAGAIQYEYGVGPDGRRYVTNGKVAIEGDAPSGDPKAAERMGRRMAAAAMSAQAPSAADFAAAAEGYRLAGEARNQASQSFAA